MFITAYCPVKGQPEPRMLSVVAQHKRVLGTASDPWEDMLSDLHKLIEKIHQMNHFVVLGIDANETFRQGGSIQHTWISNFCSGTGLVDTIFEKHDQYPIPSCDWFSNIPIDFFLLPCYCIFE